MTESATATALLDAAEARFAAEGIGRASLRAVMRDAGTDPGAIHYHFRGRDRLAEAVLDRILVPLNDRRLALLDELESAGRELLTMGALVEALVRPDIEMAARLESRGSGRARLLGAIYLDPEVFVTEQVTRRFAPVAERFVPAMTAAAPDVPVDVLAWRVRWCVFGTLGALLTDPVAPIEGASDDLVARLVRPLASALVAPQTVSS